MSQENGFYTKLEQSILKDGFRNPIVATYYMKKMICNYGGSRLWLAQAHNLKIPCIVADYDNAFPDAIVVEPFIDNLRVYFKDQPYRIAINKQGVRVFKANHYHLENEVIQVNDQSDPINIDKQDTQVDKKNLESDVMYNVVCVKWGTKYGPEYVNILKAMVDRNLSFPHKFFCFTENTDGLRNDIEILDIDTKLNGWWNKLLLFQKEIPGLVGKTLYLDLDVVIVNPIDELFKFKEDFVIIEDWMYKVKNRRPRPIVYNSSVFVYTVGQQHHVWDNFDKDRKTVLATNPGDQDYITKQIPNAKGFPDGWCRSFKWGYHFSELAYDFSKGFHDETKIVVFHGSPNPPEALVGNKNRQGRYPASPWIGKYWKE